MEDQACEKVSHKLKGMEDSAIEEMRRLGEKKERSGEKVIYLQAGEPDFDTPEIVKKAAIEGLLKGYTHYTPPEGLIELREVIADKLKTENQIIADPYSEITVTNGSYFGLFLACMACLNPGDEVLISSLAFGSHIEIIRLAGGKPVLVDLQEEKGQFRWKEDALKKKINERTKAILICSPNNPTGSVMKKSEVKMICDIAKRYNLMIISDELYEKIIFDNNQHHSPASLSEDAKNRTITINSFSKTYAMTGWRLGYVVANPIITKAMRMLLARTARCASSFIQFSGIVCLRERERVYNHMIDEYKKRRAYVVSRLNQIKGLVCPYPEGTFYAFFSIKDIGMNSRDFTCYLLNEENVVLTPGEYFGSKGKYYVRLSFATSMENLEIGIEAIRRGLDKL